MKEGTKLVTLMTYIDTLCVAFRGGLPWSFARIVILYTR